MGFVTIGADIGQRHDPTAVCVVETESRSDPDVNAGRAEVHFMVRHIARLTLGTAYPGVVTEIVRVVAGARKQSDGVQNIYVDATGVGTPIVDMLAAAGVDVTPVYFTHGDRRSEKEDRSISLGKAWLVSRLQALFQSGRIHLPQTAETAALARELQDYEIRIDENANDRYGAFKVGAHDDLVTALGLAVQVESSGLGIWL